MLDLTLSILALVAGGVTLELFTPAHAAVSGDEQRAFSVSARGGLEELQPGNPS